MLGLALKHMQHLCEGKGRADYLVCAACACRPRQVLLWSFACPRADAITDIPFRWGRVDAASCEYDEGRLPDSEQGYNHIMAWAGDQLGFTERETVALMGAHTLGRAEPANSGYDGEWVAGDAIFDNQYFTDMIAIPWVVSVNDFTDLGIGRLTHQWNAAGRMMLNTDMALGFDLGADDPNAISHPPCGGNPDSESPLMRPLCDCLFLLSAY